MRLRLTLLSGEEALLEVAPESTVHELKVTAQREFGIHELVSSRGTLLNGHCSLLDAGLRDGETISATVRMAKLIGGRLCQAFTLLRADGTVVCWGNKVACGQYSDVRWEELRDVQKIRCSSGAFAALLGSGKVVTWGDTSCGADSRRVKDQLEKCRDLASSAFAFAAIRQDGSVVTWGDSRFGGDASTVLPKLGKDVVEITGSGKALAARTAEGRVCSWGSEDCGGDCSEVEDQLEDVCQVQSTYSAFAAIRRDGTVVAWGDKHGGGDITEVKEELYDVHKIHGSSYAFAAIRADGQVVTWGSSDSGGDCGVVKDKLQNVLEIQATDSAFAALLRDGTVVTWGGRHGFGRGGNSLAVQRQLVDVHTLSSTDGAFGALLADGTVVTWGDEDYGGDCRGVKEELLDVSEICGSNSAFAVIKSDGTVVSWGDCAVGGDSRAVKSKLQDVHCTALRRSRFAAAKAVPLVVGTIPEKAAPAAPAAPAVPTARSSLAEPPVEFGGGFALKGELGHGASGRVFECKKKDSSTLYAVKVLHLRALRLRSTAQRDLTRLGRELKILKELPPHPRIVQMVDSFEEGDWFFLVLELVRGGDLFRALMQRRPTRLFEREAAFVFWQLVDGIAFLHSRNIIHRDLKLENVLISDKHREGKLTMYNVKISDFGLSKAVTGVPEMHSVVGTQRYVAPEVLSVVSATTGGQPYDFRVDLWSLGVLTFLLLTGGYPNPESQFALDDAVCKISSEAARLILKGLLQLDPVQRFTLQDLQSRSWQTGDEDVIMLPPTTTAAVLGMPSAVGIPSDSTVCSDFEALVAPPAPLQSLNDPSILSGLRVEPEPEPGQQRMPSILPTMSFLAGMEEELRRPRPVPPAPPPATPSPHGSELLLSVSEEQLSSPSWQLSQARAASARADEMHLHVLLPRGAAADDISVVDESTLKELSAKSGCNVWTTPAEGPKDACHVVMVGTCSQCTVAQQMLADFLHSKDVTQTSFTVIMFWRNDVLLNEQEMDDLQKRSQSIVELLPKLSQEGKRSWIIRGTLVQVLEAERLIYEGPQPSQPSQSQKRKRSEDSAEPENSEPGASK